jgi:hypothetical protein
MTSIVLKVLRMDAVYWEPATAGDNGRLVFKPPVALKTFWTEGSVEVTTPEKTTALAKAEIMTSIDTAVGGYLLLGSLDKIEHPTDPLRNKEAFRIIATAKQPPIREGKPILRRAWI